MIKNIKADLCIIGAGSGGLSVAAGAAQLGLDVVLIERADMGGDCLNTGCVPSKALLAAAKQAQAHRQNHIKGIAPREPEIDFAKVKQHVFDVIEKIEPHDSQERFEGLGVRVIRESASFTGRNTVRAGDYIVQARHFVIATGSRAVIPPITGIDPDKVFTNETIFSLQEKPDHLIIIGAGPIGIEMAQAHRRLGCLVSVIDMAGMLLRDDQDHVDILRDVLIDEGIQLYEHHDVREVIHRDGGVDVVITTKGDGDDEIEKITGTHLLIAAGRHPNINDLGLAHAGVTYNKGGIIVNKQLRTNNKNIFAIGDVAGGPQFTHVAGYHAGIIIRIICFKMFWTRVDYRCVPWVTYSDPEIAQIGMTKVQAENQYGVDKIRVVDWGFVRNDRAMAENKTNGQVRVITNQKGVILGVSIVGDKAGELIGVWSLAMVNKLKIGALTNMISPYPTIGEMNKHVAGEWYKPSLFSEKTKNIIGFLKKLPF